MGTSSTARECPPSHDRIFQTSDLGACPTLTFYCGERSATICVVLGPKKSSLYSSEYTSGFSGPAASHLAAPPSPRHEGNVGQAPAILDGHPVPPANCAPGSATPQRKSTTPIKNKKGTGRLQACPLNASPSLVSRYVTAHLKLSMLGGRRM